MVFARSELKRLSTRIPKNGEVEFSSSKARRNRAVSKPRRESSQPGQTGLRERITGIPVPYLPASYLTEGEAIAVRNTNRNKLEKEGHMRQARYRFFLLPLFFVLACAGVYAQANSELDGIITDQTGAVVSGAKVTLVDPATAYTRTTVSGATGLYDINGLNPGNYNLRV